MERMTAKQAAELTGWSVSWLKRHECAWCGQTLLQALYAPAVVTHAARHAVRRSRMAVRLGGLDGHSAEPQPSMERRAEDDDALGRDAVPWRLDDSA